MVVLIYIFPMVSVIECLHISVDCLNIFLGGIFLASLLHILKKIILHA